MVDKEGKPTHGDHQELHPERVMVAIIGGFELDIDQVHGGIRTSNVDNLCKNNIETDRKQRYTGSRLISGFCITLISVFLCLILWDTEGGHEQFRGGRFTFMLVLYSEINEVRRSK